ncbi:OTU-like cysteine protease, putative [Plasmodium malariae]|uniref:OTU-like cysteine protease, putative n=1 Tax=Plasmodium malariae TaxID=5858 RepID=A0A1D3RIZ2_PLAMA|nr:OTU-like cysteine protease, putative [Plasmodium malariae]SCN45149.1 OTU-like cysteine protease, putative [Plasmodium malariae]
MKKQKRNSPQRRKKIKEKNNIDYEESKAPNGGITYSLINDYHDSNFKKNFYIKSIRTDGNCLFRAVSDQLYNYEENYKEIRKRVVEHLLKNEEKYKNFLEYDESFKSYIESLDGTWGGQLELQAVGELFKVNILIYQENGCILEIKNHSDDNKCIQLHYASSEHYNSVRFKNRALENELKCILDLREILNDKDENDSTKTFYETTENELTDENEDCSSSHIKENRKMNDSLGDKSNCFSRLMEEQYGLGEYINDKDEPYIFFVSEDENTPNAFDILQSISNGIRRKKARSRSMPGINEKFLYFFSKNQLNEKIESDSTIDNLNEKKNIEKKKQKKNEKRKINFLKCNYIGHENEDILNEYLSSIGNNSSDLGKATIRICYNKTFHKYLRLSKMMGEIEGEPEGRLAVEDNNQVRHNTQVRKNNRVKQNDQVERNNQLDEIHEGDDTNDRVELENEKYRNKGNTNLWHNDNCAMQTCSNGISMVNNQYEDKENRKSNTSNAQKDNNSSSTNSSSTGRKGYISNYEIENNFNESKKKEFDDLIHLYSEKISENKNYFNNYKNVYNCNSKSSIVIPKYAHTNNEDLKYYYLNSENARSSSIYKCSSNEEITGSSLYLDKGLNSFEMKNNLFSKNEYTNISLGDKEPLTSSNNFLSDNNKCIRNNNNYYSSKKIYNFKNTVSHIFDIIIHKYVISIDSNLLYSYGSNKYDVDDKMNKEGSSTSLFRKNSCNYDIINNNSYRPSSCMTLNYSNGIDNEMRRSNKTRSNENISHVNSSTSIRNNNDSSVNNNKCIDKKRSDCNHLNMRDMLVKRKYYNKKFINMFSKDIISKSLFHYLNADFLINEDKIKYIIPFLFHSRNVNIFKNNLNKKDFYFYEYIAFSFNLNRQKLRKKIECSKVSYEEFLLKGKHKYNKLKKGYNKKLLSLDTQQDSGVKIISL